MFLTPRNFPAVSALPILLFASIAFGQTGQSSPGTAGLDQVMEGLLTKYSIPGAALAISRNGALVYARGFGHANSASSQLVQPDSLFRLASVSKTFTAIAIMKLVEEGKIQLDQSAFALMPDLTPLSGATLNPQLSAVTVRELLNMTGGWDRSIVPDPIDDTTEISAASGLPLPISCPQVIQFQLGRPLQHAPGTTYAYSDFGYCVLGQIITEVSGMSYENYVRQVVLTPLGIHRAKEADPFVTDVVNDEVTYYDYPGAPLAQNVYASGGPLVPRPYGNHDFLATQASGGWVSTPIELLRFVNGIDGTNGGPLLQPATIQLMETESSAFGGTAGFYGLGFDMHTTTAGGFNLYKDGALPGTAAYLYRGANKTDFAVVFNSAPASASETSTDPFETDYVNQIETAITQVTSWPTTNQFASYPSTLVAPQLSTAGPPVVNAASFEPNITPGSWVAIYGSNLATATRTWYDSEFNGLNLPMEIAGVSVLIGGLPAAVYYVSPTQINVQAPLGSSFTAIEDVVVTHDGESSVAFPATEKNNSPALFTYTAGGVLWAAAETPGSGTLIGNPAVLPGTVEVKPGDYVELYANSLLLAKSGVIITTPNTLQTFPTATVGGVPAKVIYAGFIGAGLFQIDVQVPASLTAGNQQVVVTYNDSSSPTGVVIPVTN
jgi:uncharacterized protein (TIGR03437 family)